MIARLLSHIRRKRAASRLKATLKPNPSYLARRLAQFSPERKARFFLNTEGLL